MSLQKTHHSANDRENNYDGLDNIYIYCLHMSRGLCVFEQDTCSAAVLATFLVNSKATLAETDLLSPIAGFLAFRSDRCLLSWSLSAPIFVIVAAGTRHTRTRDKDKR